MVDQLQQIRLPGAQPTFRRRGLRLATLSLSFAVLVALFATPALANFNQQSATDGGDAAFEATETAIEDAGIDTADDDLEEADTLADQVADEAEGVVDSDAVADPDAVVDPTAAADAAVSDADSDDATSDVADYVADEEVEEEEEDPYQSDLWVPSLAFAVTVHDEEMDLVGENPIAFSINTTDSRTMVALRFGGELMSPVVEEIPFEPRFYVSGGVLWSPPGNSLFDIEHETQTTDDYRDTNIDQDLRTFQTQTASNPAAAVAQLAEEFEGQGNRVWGRRRHNAWYVSAGTVFTLPRSGYALRFRPSVEYAGEVFDNEGEFALMVDERALPTDIPEFYVARIALDERQTFHSLGPGLELELVNQLDGGITLSFFMQTRFMWILNDPDVKLRGDATFADESITAAALTSVNLQDLEFDINRNRFNFRGGMGVRIGFKDLGFKF